MKKLIEFNSRMGTVAHLCVYLRVSGLLRQIVPERPYFPPQQKKGTKECPLTIFYSCQNYNNANGRNQIFTCNGRSKINQILMPFTRLAKKEPQQIPEALFTHRTDRLDLKEAVIDRTWTQFHPQNFR